MTISFPRLLPWLLLIAALILLGYCGRQNHNYRQDAELARQLRQQEDSDRIKQSTLSWEYKVQRDADSTALVRAQDSSNRLKADVRSLIAQVRQKRSIYVPVNNQGFLDTSRVDCCPLAFKLADKADSVLRADSTKDMAFNQQLTHAAGMIDAQAALLTDAHTRFNRLDSLYQSLPRPRLKILAGVAGGVTPVFKWVGASAGVLTVKGMQVYGQYGVVDGGGVYYGLGVMRVISLKRK